MFHYFQYVNVNITNIIVRMCIPSYYVIVNITFTNTVPTYLLHT